MTFFFLILSYFANKEKTETREDRACMDSLSNRKQTNKFLLGDGVHGIREVVDVL